MRDPGKAFRENPKQSLVIDLTHDAVGPLYGHVGEAGDGNNFARSHSEQHMRVSGSIRFGDGDPISFGGHGLRDHSWGPRYWQSTPSYRWITGNFGDDLGMIIRTNSQGEGGGLFHEGQKLVRFKVTGFETEYQSGTGFHTGLKAELQLEDGRQRSLAGKVMGFIPLRNRRSGKKTHVGEGMTEYTLDDGRKGYGLSEYLDQPED
jgi:hypothetical protein